MKARAIAAVVAAFLLLAGTVLIQHALDRKQLRVLRSGEDEVVFPNASILKVLSLGHSNLVADYYWLKAIQYLGNCLTLKAPPAQMYKYAQFVTDIDPQFFEAYYYPAAVMIADRLAPAETILLLEKGRQHLPQAGELAFQLGFAYYYFEGDRQKAARNLKDAAVLRDYPPYAMLAARILAEGNNPDLSLSLLEELDKGYKLDKWGGSVAQMVAGFNQQKIIIRLNQLIEQFHAEKKRYPDGLPELVSAGLIKALPQDPLGGAFFFDRQNLRAKSTREFYAGVYKSKGQE